MNKKFKLACLPEQESSANNVAQLFENERLLTYKQAAIFLSVSPRTLRKWVSARSIPFVRVGEVGVRFRVSSLVQWTKEREIA